MLDKLAVNSFKWLMKISKKAIMKKVMKDISLKFMFNILKNYITFTMTYTFSIKRKKMKKKKKNGKFVANFHYENEYIKQIRNLK